MELVHNINNTIMAVLLGSETALNKLEDNDIEGAKYTLKLIQDKKKETINLLRDLEGRIVSKEEC